MSETTSSNMSSHPAFELLRTQKIDSLKVEIEEYIHLKTGARHLHLAADNDENVFLVGLKTVPQDNKGVAHILEHTALCGSERFPVRDPFFMMIRRSLNTFMNAFTSSDWTAYPFASKNRKDFDNLLSVYLDSVFFSSLDRLDFAQEGHRLEFEETNNVESNLTYKGVVYNEMKGAMSSPISQLWQTLTKYVFPTTTYHYNSGGEPEHITDLSYDELIAFYRKHYHPSNAVFLTFGNIPAFEHHEKFEELVLNKFDKQHEEIVVTDEKRYFSPVRIQESYPVNSEDETQKKTHIVMGWLLGHSFNLEQNLEAHLLSNVLFENSASPLQKALETTSLGHAPSPLCGLEDSNREMTFVCGVEGSEVDSTEAVEVLVNSVLEKVAEEGVAKERLEAVLHQLELSQREISGDHYPYGLQLILGALSPMLHGGDPVELLDLEPVIENLRNKIEDPDYIKGLVKRLLLENPHRVTLSLKPDASYEGQREKALQAELAKIKDQLSSEEKQQIVDQAKALAERQSQKDDETILPKVGIEDVPLALSIPESKTYASSSNIETYGQGTNGLVYHQVIVDLPALSEDEISVLPIYTSCLTEMGAGNSSYLDIQNKQSEVTGGIAAYSSIKGSIDDEQNVSGYIVFSGKALARNSDALALLMKEIVLDVRFDESERLHELVSQIRAKKEQSITSNGHGLAMGAATSLMSPIAKLSFNLGGLLGIKHIKELDDSLSDPKALKRLQAALSDLHEKVSSSKRRFLVIAEPEKVDEVAQFASNIWDSVESVDHEAFSLKPVREQVKQGWLTATQVNFCAKAYPTVAIEHADSAALTVLGGFLRNGYLHRTIREQGGAYGGGAGQDSGIAAFRFFSYRDPRLEETLTDFDRSLEWMQTENHEASALEEAVLGVVSQIDKPKSPAGEAKSDYHSELFGRTAEQRVRFRQRVLEVTLDDLKRVTKRYFSPEKASVAVVTSPTNRALIESLGLDVQEL
ncbi:insulinase family protein [Alkalimarinus alittae]|uniref:Insulinase family protein n=1 Tax=Alkalimarinus alittae TaxID=2961619 RepID=A0ABY6MY63_9ALTE|nr:insulinase family protein [Alkalimarinus alittae]UZE94717.1 insulinase family protein [Alkalimarinus alittae]